MAPSEQLVLAASNLAGVHLFYELSFLLVNTAFREVSCASIAGKGIYELGLFPLICSWFFPNVVLYKLPTHGEKPWYAEPAEVIKRPK